MNKKELERLDRVEKTSSPKKYEKGEMGIRYTGNLYLPAWFCRKYDLEERCNIYVDTKEKDIAIEFVDDGEYKVTIIGNTGYITVKKTMTYLGIHEDEDIKRRVDVEYDEEDKILYVDVE